MKFIQGHFQTRNFNCTAAEVTEANFKTRSLFVYLLPAEIFFCLQPTTKHFPFSFQQCTMRREFCHSFTKSQPENHKFQVPLSSSLIKILVTCGPILGTSGDLALVRQQPWFADVITKAAFSSQLQLYLKALSAGLTGVCTRNLPLSRTSVLPTELTRWWLTSLTEVMISRGGIDHIVIVTVPVV